ncbi:hypothetical protein Nmel_005034, partial [Mimus melanotis]
VGFEGEEEPNEKGPRRPQHHSTAPSSSSPHVGVPNLELTIRNPHDGDEHHGSHEDVEEREPPAKEQQVKDVPKCQRGACGRDSTSWDHCHLQLPKSTLPPPGLSPRPPTSRASDDIEVRVELLDNLRSILPGPRCHVALPFLEAKLQREFCFWG